MDKWLALNCAQSNHLLATVTYEVIDLSLQAGTSCAGANTLGDQARWKMCVESWPLCNEHESDSRMRLSVSSCYWYSRLP